MTDAAQICLHAFVSGKVQGVWFRQSTKQQALAHGVSGWAKNLADGRVEVMLCGPATAVHTVAAWLEQGPQYAQVAEVQRQELAFQFLSGFETF